MSKKTVLTFGNLYDPQVIEGGLPELLNQFNAAFAQHHGFIMVHDADDGLPVVVSVNDVIKMKEIDG